MIFASSLFIHSTSSNYSTLKNLFNGFLTKEIFLPFSSKNPKLKFFKKNSRLEKWTNLGRKMQEKILPNSFIFRARFWGEKFRPEFHPGFLPERARKNFHPKSFIFWSEKWKNLDGKKIPQDSFQIAARVTLIFCIKGRHVSE